MNQSELYHSVARATGEDLDEIRHRGFNLVEPEDLDFDPDLDVLLEEPIDWDQYDLERNIAIVEQRQYRYAA